MQNLNLTNIKDQAEILNSKIIALKFIQRTLSDSCESNEVLESLDWERYEMLERLELLSNNLIHSLNNL